MKAARVSRSVLISMAALIMLSAVSQSAFASHSWGGYHWARTSNSFTLKLGDNLTSSWDPYLATASSDWSKSTVLDTVIDAGQSNKRCAATTGRVEVCNGKYGQNGWLGVAQIWLSGSHITKGTVKVNDTYFSMARYNNTSEKKHVMCQEVGHTFGLDHQDESGASLDTCMDYYQNTSNSDTKSTSPNQHDYDQLVTIYSHTDSTTTIGASAGRIRAGQAELNSRADWGRLVHTSANGRSSTFVRDFGGGNKAVTFVYWVDSAGR